MTRTEDRLREKLSYVGVEKSIGRPGEKPEKRFFFAPFPTTRPRINCEYNRVRGRLRLSTGQDWSEFVIFKDDFRFFVREGISSELREKFS